MVCGLADAIKYTEVLTVQGGQKSKPLPNYQKIVLNRIKACH